MGCRIKKSPRDRHGKVKLAFRLIFRGLDGREVRSWEGTELEDTPANRRLMEARAVIIEHEMKSGTFNYLAHFPHGNKAAALSPAPVAAPLTIAQGYERWIETKKPPLVRKSRPRDYRQHFNAYLKPEIGSLFHDQVDVEKLTWLRSRLLEHYGISVKTAKEAISSTLSAYWRDLPSIGLNVHNPFKDLPERWWPKVSKPEPDPFTEEERDAIIEWSKAKSPYWRFIFFQFHQGTRPSEAAALRLRNVDLKNLKIVVTKSRYLGEDNPPKTTKSAATIDLFPHVAEVIEPLIPLHADPDMYLFRNAKGGPVDQHGIGKYVFNPALRAKNIRQRDFYSTRDTFISIALSKNIPPKWISEHCRTSLRMIEEDYGKWMKGVGVDPVALLSGAFKEQKRRARRR